MATELDQVVDLHVAIMDFSTNSLTAFDGLLIHEKKEMIRRCVSRIVFDDPNGVIRCYLRKSPFASEDVADLLEEGKKCKTAPGDQMPFRNVEVAGTGLEPATFGL